MRKDQPGRRETEVGRTLRWMRLDNAALIFPAALRKNWSNAFRISVSFRDEVEVSLLEKALSQVAPRFPSVFVRLRRGLFWYYLQEIELPPKPEEDGPQPLRGMTKKDIKRCAIRVLYYKNRMAVEFFHAVTDGGGALVFVKTLAAQYVRLRYGISVPEEEGIKRLSEEPSEEELEDSFQKYAGDVSAARDPGGVFHLGGTLEKDRFLHVTLGRVDEEPVLQKAREHGVTVTAYLVAILLEALLEIQSREVPNRRKQKPVKVQIPVDLRRLYGSKTMRNFVAVVNIGVDPRMGEYSREELIKIVHHQMQLFITAKNMSAIFRPNVESEKNPALRPIPLFLKNIVMRAVFDSIGESVSCLCFSNLGHVRLPEAMKPYVERVEFVLGPQSIAPYNVSATGYGGEIYVNVVRNTEEPVLEEAFFTRLVKSGCHVKLETNG